MRVNDDLYMVPVTMELPGRTMVMNLSLIVDASSGPTLVDTSMPGTLADLESALDVDGLNLTDIQQIVITHQDVDHIGGLGDLLDRTHAKVLAHEVEIPYIDGRPQLVKFPSSETLAQNPRMKELYGAVRFCPVDQALNDGDRLDLAGGVRVIYTPGHSPGHVCLFLERSKVLISGDALTST